MKTLALFLLLGSCTSADVTPDTLMVGYPTTGDFDAAYVYLAWAIPQPVEPEKEEE